MKSLKNDKTGLTKNETKYEEKKTQEFAKKLRKRCIVKNVKNWLLIIQKFLLSLYFTFKKQKTFMIFWRKDYLAKFRVKTFLC